jgi:hypothetical protein
MDEDLTQSFYISNFSNEKESNQEGVEECNQENEELEFPLSPRSNDNCESLNSPKLIDKPWIQEINKYFKLNTLLNLIRNTGEEKHDISISNGIMNSIIYKKLGTITYHYNGKKSKKAYHTYDYPEIYYNKKLYTNTNDWIKDNFK